MTTVSMYEMHSQEAWNTLAHVISKLPYQGNQSQGNTLDILPKSLHANYFIFTVSEHPWNRIFLI